MSGGGAALGADARLLALGDAVPPLMEPPAGLSFRGWRRSGALIWLSGHGPNHRTRPPDFDYKGKLGADLSAEEGYAAARLVGLNLLVTLRHAVGSLDWVAQIVSLTGAVASAEGFVGQSAVMNGCSDLLRDIFGEAGTPTRTVLGVPVLPFGMAVEANLVAEIV